LFTNGSLQRLAVSSAFTVTGAAPTLGVSPSDAVAGGTTMAMWSGIPAPTATDWIGLYAAGSADTNYQVRWNTNGRASDAILVTLPGGTSDGSYEMRLFSNNTFTRLAVSNPFTVAAGAGVQASPVAVAPGATLNVNWSGIAQPSATDWIAVVSLNGQDA